MIFGAPFLLWALALGTVPIIIHLLNRRRYKNVDWAPMKYLKLSLRTNRRKVRLEQLLLLLIRILFVVGVVMAVCRPRVDRGGGLDWLAFHTRVSRLLILDDSLSMDARVGETSSFDLGRDAADRLITALDSRDSLTVLVTSRLDGPLAEASDLGQRTAILQALAELKGTDTGATFAEVLDKAERALARAPFPVRECTLITDLRAQGWSDDVKPVASRLAASGIALRIIDVGLPVQGNLSVSQLRQDSPAALAKHGTPFIAEVRNDDIAAVGPLDATLETPEGRRTVQVPRIGAGETVRVPFSVTFANPGIQPISFVLPRDVLPADDRRQLAVQVRERLDIVLVDGDPSSEPFQGEADFLRVAFTIGELPWQVFALTDAEWLDSTPRADLTILANVQGLREEHVLKLESLVKGGMGLILFPGHQTDPAGWNELLWRDGRGLLPTSVSGLSSEPTKGLLVAEEANSPLELLKSVAPEALQRIAATKRLEMRGDSHPDTRRLAHWDDAEESVAVMDRRVGRGRVLLFSTTADRDWSDWPTDPTWLLTMREAGLRLAHPGRPGLEIEAGRPWTVPVDDPAVTGGEALVPGAEQRVPVSLRSGDDPALIFERTHHAGIYSMSWVDGTAQTVEISAAVNPVSAESRLQPLDPGRLQELVGVLRPTVTHHSDLKSLLEGEGREVWRALAWAALALLAVESILMVWVGRQG